MARYIDADKVMEEIARMGGHGLCEWSTLGFKALINRQPTADVAPRAEWISAEERLPEKAGRYLVYGVIGGQPLVCGAHYDNYNGFGDDDITHWMPMPQPPRGGHHE